MQTNATPEQTQLAAEKVGVELYETRTIGKRFHFTLRPIRGSEKYRKINPINGRRIHAICWHGHAAFMHALVAIKPDALIKSHVATYKGYQDFLENHGKTAHTQVGPMMTPYTMGDCCKCNQ